MEVREPVGEKEAADAGEKASGGKRNQPVLGVVFSRFICNKKLISAVAAMVSATVGGRRSRRRRYGTVCFVDCKGE